MKQTQKRRCQSSPEPSSTPPGQSDARTQSDADDTNIAVSDDDQTGQELTNAEELLRAQKIASNAKSKAYPHYGVPKLSTQLDKKGRFMIAYPCKLDSRCGDRMHRPTSDSSCSNLLKHMAVCRYKQKETAGNQSLASLGISGTGDLDLREVNQLCALWCAEAARPFSALADESHKRILHPTILKHLPAAKVVSRLIHMIYTAVQDEYREVLQKHVGAMYLGADAWQSPNGHDILGILILRPFGKVLKKQNGSASLEEESEPGSDTEDPEGQIHTSTWDNEDTNEIKDSEDDGDETSETELSAEDINDLSEEDEEKDAYTSVSCKKTLPKFHAIAHKLRKSPNLKAEFVRLCKEMGCSKPHNIERDVRT
ncbi:hypothetical protein MJO29_016209 [Puccinia striiformis f. sp. tritici]|nr:hypothetical protein MJO29_016209 [Puccinia striiformis f. sp. tritici]